MIRIAAATMLWLSQQMLMPVTEGLASYYTVASSSPITASGEPMRDDALTCAMLEGEFGTYYLVVAEDGGTVICRLNDRGPYVAGRVIDLSAASMRQLAGRDGMANVKVYRLGAFDELLELGWVLPLPDAP